ncbi:MAG: hypothetical protein ACREDR_37145 [Blastocatellia bacterium]
MRRISYFFSAILLLIPFSAATAQSPAPTIRQADLKKTAISAGALRITFTEFKGVKALFGKTEVVDFLVENTSSSFVTFSPSRLLFVNEDGTQVDVFAVYYSGRDFAGYLPAADHDLAPNTHMTLKFDYDLSDRLELPARVFYDHQLIAQIIK